MHSGYLFAYFQDIFERHNITKGNDVHMLHKGEN